MAKLSDYQRALDSVDDIPKFYLGQEVHTKDGTGIIVKMEMNYNGLYIVPDSSTIVVWYSTEGAVDRVDGGRWITFTYNLTELTLINYGRIRV